MVRRPTHLKEIPYWYTASKPDFQTRVTSQALVAWSLQERKADTAFPPTEHILISSRSAIIRSGCNKMHAPVLVLLRGEWRNEGNHRKQDRKVKGK